MPSATGVEVQPRESSEYKLRKQLLLLAALVVGTGIATAPANHSSRRITGAT